VEIIVQPPRESPGESAVKVSFFLKVRWKTF